MSNSTGIILVRVGVKGEEHKLSSFEIDMLDFSFSHPLISHFELVASSYSPIDYKENYLEYELYLEMDLDSEGVKDVVDNLELTNESDVMQGHDIFCIQKDKVYYDNNSPNSIDK